MPELAIAVPPRRAAGPSAQHRAAVAAGGASKAEIARQLFLLVSTVGSHLERIYAKLGHPRAL